MKPSHLKTPRSMNECHWTSGYECGPPHEPLWETIGGYLLALAIGIGLAALLFFGASS